MPRFPYRALLRDSVRTQGPARTAWELLTGAGRIALDYLPARRRVRFGDIEFDCDHRVNTTWANLPLGTRIRELFAGRAYQPTDPFLFRAMMQHLTADPGALTFLDLGSGKGRALLLAAEYPFRRILGVELLPELHAIAEENVRRYRASNPHCVDIEVFCADARRFPLPPEPLFLYLFDPFTEPILREVIAEVEDSLRQRPRPLWIGYQNPVSEHVIAESPAFQKSGGTQQWALYEVKW